MYTIWNKCNINRKKKSDRRTSDPTKYFGIELGAQTHIDTVNERYIVNGSHDEMKMQEILGTWVVKSHFQNFKSSWEKFSNPW